jgi:hypothetical protein
MKLANLFFIFITPLVLIALIAGVVSGLGTGLLVVREIGDHAHDLGQLSETGAKLYAVALALAIATVILVGGTVASRMAGPDPSARPARDVH